MTIRTNHHEPAHDVAVREDDMLAVCGKALRCRCLLLAQGRHARLGHYLLLRDDRHHIGRAEHNIQFIRVSAEAAKDDPT